MHILIIPSFYTNHDKDLCGQFFVDQAKALQKYGHQVTVAYVETRSIRKLVKDLIFRRWKSGFYIKNEGLKEYRWRIYNWYMKIPYGKDRLVWKKLNRMTAMVRRDEKPVDIIHLHSFISHGYGTDLISRRTGIPYVITEHSSRIPRGELKPYQEKIIKKIGRSASAVIAVGSGVADYYRKQTGREVSVIPNMVDTEHFKPVSKEIHSSDFTILSLGHLSYRKGFDLLIEAFALLFPDYPEMRLVIAGEGDFRKDLVHQIQKLNKKHPGIQERIELSGAVYRNDVPALIARADLFALASRNEPFGVVVIEALAMGVPVVATANPGPLSILNEKCGVLVENENPQALAEGIKRVREGGGQYDPEAIRAHCQGRYGEEAVCRQLSAVYEKVLKPDLKRA